MKEKLNLFWADAHANLHASHLEGIEKLFTHATELIDFWPIAYYPHDYEKIKGFPVEIWLKGKRIKEDWKFKEHYREDPFWFHAYKFKIHREIPETAYKVKFTYQENHKEKKEDYYMVKVIQKNGSCAWSSPIWVR